MKYFWDIYFDLKSLTGGETFNPTEWADNPPRYLRYQMLLSVCDALSIGLKDIEEGTYKIKATANQFDDFLNRYESNTKNKKFKTIIERYKNESSYCVVLDSQLTSLFYSLLRVRKTTFEVESQFSGLLAASGVYTLPVMINNSIAKGLQKEKKFIDDILMFLMNPNQLDISRLNLIAKFQFPNVDLEEIDFDFF